MAAVKPRQPLSDEALAELLKLLEGADTVELKLTVPESRPALGRPGARDGPARRPDPPGVLLRHPRPDPQRARAGRPGATRAGEGRRLGRQAAAGRPERLPPSCAQLAELRRRGRRDAGRVRLLGLDEARAAASHVRDAVRGRAPAAQALLEGTAGLLRRARTRTDSALDDLAVLGPHLRAQAEVRAQGVRPPARRGDVALPRRLADPRAVDEMRALRRRSRRPPRARAFLASRGVDLSGEQATKTKKALRYFSGRLARNAQ